MLFEVIKNYKNNDSNPIELLAGDTVQLGELSNPNGPYPNWIFCVSNRTGRKGWVAAHILAMENDVGTAIEAYTAKEMAVTAGDVVETIYELNGWYWCLRKADAETGWVAKDNLKAIV